MQIKEQLERPVFLEFYIAALNTDAASVCCAPGADSYLCNQCSLLCLAQRTALQHS